MQTEYFVFIHRPGPNWLDGVPITGQPLEGHLRYMADLAASGTLVLGGGFTDDAGAMGVLHASDPAEAESLVHRDPAVSDGVVIAEVHPYFVTVAAGITPGVV